MRAAGNILFMVVTSAPCGSCTAAALLHICVCVQSSLVLEQNPSLMDCVTALSQYINSPQGIHEPSLFHSNTKKFKELLFFLSKIVPAACELPMLEHKN